MHDLVRLEVVHERGLGRSVLLALPDPGHGRADEAVPDALADEADDARAVLCDLAEELGHTRGELRSWDL